MEMEVQVQPRLWRIVPALHLRRESKTMKKVAAAIQAFHFWSQQLLCDQNRLSRLQRAHKKERSNLLQCLVLRLARKVVSLERLSLKSRSMWIDIMTMTSFLDEEVDPIITQGTKSTEILSWRRKLIIEVVTKAERLR